MKTNALRIIFATVLIGLLGSAMTFAQRPSKETNQKKKPNRVAYRSYYYQKPYFEMGVSIGPAVGLTDAAPSKPLTEPSLADLKHQDIGFIGGVYGRYRFNSTWGARSELNFTRLAGADANSPSVEVQERGKIFTNNIFELSAIGEVYLPQKIRTYNQQMKNYSFNYYFMGGASVIYHDPKVSGPIIDDSDYVQQTSNDTYRNIQPVFPIGTGFYLNFNETFTIGAELGARFTLFDYLDGFSRIYSPRYDHYFFGGVKLGFVIKQGKNSPNVIIEKQVFKPKSKD